MSEPRRWTIHVCPYCGEQVYSDGWFPCGHDETRFCLEHPEYEQEVDASGTHTSFVGGEQVPARSLVPREVEVVEAALPDDQLREKVAEAIARVWWGTTAAPPPAITEGSLRAADAVIATMTGGGAPGDFLRGHREAREQDEDREVLATQKWQERRERLTPEQASALLASSDTSRIYDSPHWDHYAAAHEKLRRLAGVSATPPDQLRERAVNALIDSWGIPTEVPEEAVEAEARQSVKVVMEALGVSATPAPAERERCPECGIEPPYHVGDCSLRVEALASARGFTDEDVERGAEAIRAQWEDYAKAADAGYDHPPGYRDVARAVLAAIGPKEGTDS